jgi:hypothetical protein
MKVALRAALFAVLALGHGRAAHPQALPSEPLSFADGHVTVGGDVSATFGCQLSTESSTERCGKDTGFFNYTDYENSALRLFHADLTTSIGMGGHFAVLGEMSTDNGDGVHAYALYLRIRPWIDRPFDIQAGRVPPTFGAFGRHVYSTDNLLIGYPLAYQYLTSLRADALPVNADELLSMRGRGWLSQFSLGNRDPAAGLPLATAFRWDTGVQVHAAAGPMVDATAAVTAGTLSNPLFADDNSGRQIAGRLSVHPLAGLLIGASAARGPFVSNTAARGAVGDGHDGAFTQTAFGGDIEYSHAYYLVRAETVLSEWKVPAVGTPVIDTPLRALATYVEGRYKVHPGLYIAARLDHLGFNEVTGSLGPQTWDAPVSRIEVGGGYSIQRNLLLKVSWQHNTRDGGRVTRETLGAAQLLFWF